MGNIVPLVVELSDDPATLTRDGHDGLVTLHLIDDVKLCQQARPLWGGGNDRAGFAA